MKARIYLRVSAEDERDILENQRRTLLEYVSSKGWELAAQPYEEIASGGDDGRVEINRLMKEVRKGEIVLFTAPSRMTRGGMGAALYLLNQLQGMGVGWHFTEYPVLNFDADTPLLVRNVILAILAEIDRDYRERISKATRAAYARRRALAEARGETVRWGRPKKAPLLDDGGNRAPGQP